MQVPELVQSGESLWLNCSFDQGVNRLYSLKWYKDGTEFYRYIRQDPFNGFEAGPIQTSFDLPGVHVEVSIKPFDCHSSFVLIHDHDHNNKQEKTKENQIN
jgi:hypothetical protein